jgi:methionyl aminopeptidase
MATDTEQEKFDKHRTAGKILAEVRAEAVKKVKVGVSLLETAEFVENLIRQKGAQPAFPCNISRNDEAAHATPSANDTSVFGNDMVKLDIGVHIDGYIADTAITVDLSGHPELVKAAEDALGAAIKLIRAGINTGEVGAVIEKTINDLGYRPIMNLTGHGLERWNQHAPPAIPNKKFDRGAVLKEGAVVAIEPFATNGSGHVSERGIAEIYRLAESKSVRLPAARKVAGELERYRGLPFAKRWLRIERADFALRQLEQVGAVHSYPVLKEDGKGLISQAEHTVIVTKDGCEVVTL